MKRGTLSELSRLTGFSKTTISRILSGKADKYRVSDTTQRLVMSIYRLTCENVDGAAQQLRNNSYRTIGLAVPSISNPLFGQSRRCVFRDPSGISHSIVQAPFIQISTCLSFLCAIRARCIQEKICLTSHGDLIIREM